MYLTFVSGWWEIAHRYGFLYVAIENHQDVAASAAVATEQEPVLATMAPTALAAAVAAAAGPAGRLVAARAARAW